MPKELIEIYNSLSEVKQQELFDFASYLLLREKNDGSKIVRLMEKISEKAERDGISEMSMEEIDAEIAAARAERDNKIFLQAQKSIKNCQKIAAKNGIADMSMEEIDEEIALYRAGK